MWRIILNTGLREPAGRRWSAVPLRLIVGYGFLAHGFAKVANGPDHFAASLHTLGVPAPHVMAWATIGFELAGGLAVLLGAWIPLVSIPLAAILLVAAITVHWPYGFSSIKLRTVTAAGPQFGPPGYEMDLLYLAALATLALGGAGPWSISEPVGQSKASTVATIPVHPTPDEVQQLEDRIYEFNVGATRIAGGELLAFFVREGGRIVAGICGNTWGGTCELRQFWVEESQRRRGLGTTLLQAAEDEARRRGCTQIVLMTFSFQAPAFYERMGFEAIASIDNHPRGHQNLLMRKRLTRV